MGVIGFRSVMSAGLFDRTNRRGRWSVSGVEEIALRLAAIQGELAALPEGPSAERYQLLKERDGLRQAASQYAVDLDLKRPTEELEAELTSLKQRRRQLVESRSGYVMGKGGNNQGPASAAWVQLSVSARSASGIDALNVRISHLEDVLSQRSGNGQTPQEGTHS